MVDDGLDMKVGDNHTDGAWEIAPGVQNISISSMQFGLRQNLPTCRQWQLLYGENLGWHGWPAGGNERNPLDFSWYVLLLWDGRRPVNSWSGIRILDMGPDDVVDIPYINGDFEVFSNAGTVISGFHLTGVTVVSAPLTSPDSVDLTDAGQSLFVGELMTFKCCQQVSVLRSTTPLQTVQLLTLLWSLAGLL